MAVRPLNRRKIVKKITRIPRRFQSHQWKRVNVSTRPDVLTNSFSPTPTEP